MEEDRRTFLLLIFQRISLVDARSEVRRISAEGDFEGAQELFHEKKQANKAVREMSFGLVLFA